jgi:hypothetical protein
MQDSNLDMLEDKMKQLTPGMRNKDVKFIFD